MYCGYAYKGGSFIKIVFYPSERGSTFRLGIFQKWFGMPESKWNHKDCLLYEKWLKIY